ncbi:MAG: ATPase, T2SS/T4P/T4SS family [Myxococcota bacterium]|nr:ATPase, T2SS/T4P/T4SS family [Myxococcota bacterium]
MGRVASRFDVHLADPASLHDEGRWAAAQAAVQAAIAESEAAGALGARVDRSELTAIALREAVGLGALEPLLTDESVREVVVEGPQRIVADRGEGLQPVAGGFSSSAALLTVARRLFAQAGEALDPSRPIQETALPYGPHVTVVLPPVAVRGPIVEVRRMGQPRSADQLVTSGRLSPAMLETLRAAVAAHRNVVVAGPVGSGVSSLLGALAGLCDPGERIVTIEDIPDVAVAGRDDVVTLVAARGATGLRLRDLLPQASRLRADRIVVDDVTASELFDVLCALVARQPGHFVGFHTSGSGEGIVPLQSALTLGAAAASEHAVADLLARGVHVLVECARCDDGARRVVRVAELVRGRLVDLHLWSGEFRATGARGTFEG